MTLGSRTVFASARAIKARFLKAAFLARDSRPHCGHLWSNRGHTSVNRGDKTVNIMAAIRLPYVKCYLDRHGKARYYFRRKGFPNVALPPIGSPGFTAAYEAANAIPISQPACAHAVFAG